MRGSIAAAISLIFLVTPTVGVWAQSTGYPTAIMPTIGAPLTIATCRDTVYNNGINGGSFYVNVANRTTHALLSVAIEFRYYDQDGTVIGERTLQTRLGTPLASADSGLYRFDNSMNLSEPVSAIVRASCRLQSAAFTGEKQWTYPQKWAEQLLPIAANDGTNIGSSGDDHAAPLSAHPSLKMTVSKAWNDSVNGALFVHDAVVIEGSDADATLTPGQLVLTMQLANGSKKQYFGLARPAPTYQKLNPLGSTTVTAYEVDPRNDLGAIGSLIVPAHGTVSVTVTFLVSDVVADPSANNTVAVR